MPADHEILIKIAEQNIRITSLEKRADNTDTKLAEIMTEIKSGNNRLTEKIEDNQKDLGKKIDDLKTLSNIAKGAIAVAGSLLTVGITIAVKHMG